MVNRFNTCELQFSPGIIAAIGQLISFLNNLTYVNRNFFLFSKHVNKRKCNKIIKYLRRIRREFSWKMGHRDNIQRVESSSIK